MHFLMYSNVNNADTVFVKCQLYCPHVTHGLSTVMLSISFQPASFPPFFFLCYSLPPLPFPVAWFINMRGGSGLS